MYYCCCCHTTTNSTKCQTNLHLLVHSHADGELDAHEEGHAGTDGPRDDGEDEDHVGGDGGSVTPVERTGALVGAVGVVGSAVWIIGGVERMRKRS